MSTKNGESKQFTRVVIVWVIALFLFLVFGIRGCIIEWREAQNKRKFIEYISVNIEEAERYFREVEGWEMGLNTEEERLFLSITTQEEVQYIFIETYSGDEIHEIRQEVIWENDGKTSRGILHLYPWTWDGQDCVDVYLDMKDYGGVSVKYSIPEFELINDWGDPGEAELSILEWVSKDKYRADWEYAEEIMQKLEAFVQEE